MFRNEINTVKRAIRKYALDEFWMRGIDGVNGEKPTHNSELFEDIIIMVRKAGYRLHLTSVGGVGRPAKKKRGVK